jgi:hypothetical protein
MTVTHKNTYIEIGFTANEWERDLASLAMDYIRPLCKDNYILRDFRDK